MLALADRIVRHLPTPLRHVAATRRRRRAPLDVRFDLGFPVSPTARAIAHEVAGMVWARHLPRAGEITIDLGVGSAAQAETDSRRIVIAPTALTTPFPSRTQAIALVLTVAAETMRYVLRNRRRTAEEIRNPMSADQLEVQAQREANDVLSAIAPAGYDWDGEPYWLINQSAYAAFVTPNLLALIERAGSEGDILFPSPAALVAMERRLVAS